MRIYGASGHLSCRVVAMDGGLYYAKVHERGGERVVAVCDAELLGSVLREGDLEFEIREEFYGGMLVDLDTALELIEQGTIVNVVGERIVGALAEREELVKLAVVKIAGVPHLQWIR